MVTLPTPAKGFSYDDNPQRSPAWFDLHIGRVGASQLGAWFAASKAKGTPLKPRLDLEKEIMFSKAFNTRFDRFVSSPMQQGIEFEPLARQRYAEEFGVEVEEVGCFFNKYFIASPDGLIGDDGGLEIKWLQDSNFMEVITSNQPLRSHYLQIQGNLWASGRKWWDYMVCNLNTQKFKVIRIVRDEETIQSISESVKAVADIAPLKVEDMHSFGDITLDPTIVGEENPWK